MKGFDFDSFGKRFEAILSRTMNQTAVPLTFCGNGSSVPSNNGTNITITNTTATNCSTYNGDLWDTIFDDEAPFKTTPANLFFAYFTPIVFTIGMVGNILSLIVFMSKNMRQLSASIYLAALSISDLMALTFYVLPEWLKYGLVALPGHHTVAFLQNSGICQLLLYLQYISRFLSSWILVLFTIERFIGVCFPLKRRKDICDSKATLRVILGAVLAAAVACVFKPILSRSYITRTGGSICTSISTHQYLSFILDSIFGVAITFIPFVVITGLNLLIIRKLVQRNRRQRKIRLITEESVIRLEFTFILLALSICFVALNLPYFAVWCERYLTSEIAKSDTISLSKLSLNDNHIGSLDEILHVTRTIFYINYCINFFLYSVTGAYFRKELKQLFLRKGHQSKYRYTSTAHSQHYSRSLSHTTPQSWV